MPMATTGNAKQPVYRRQVEPVNVDAEHEHRQDGREEATPRRSAGGVSGPKSSRRPTTKIGSTDHRSAAKRSSPDRRAPDRMPTAIASPPTRGVGVRWTAWRALTCRRARFANAARSEWMKRRTSNVLRKTSNRVTGLDIILRLGS